jgi:hypothetical protein
MRNSQDWKKTIICFIVAKSDADVNQLGRQVR